MKKPQPPKQAPLFPQSDRPVTIHGKQDGFKSLSVIVWPDNSMTRGDVPLELATRIWSPLMAAHILGMSREQFMAEHKRLCGG